MLSEKEMKRRVKEEASRDPEGFFPTEMMREKGLRRGTCTNCGTYFWSADPEREVCGEPSCEGGYSFIGRKACLHKMDFIDVWKRFSDLFERRGYTPIARYPSISRWNPTSEFTLASITDFQPYVVRGSVKPPANPLVVPQTCLRFNDVDNVGITGRHNTGFIMIGQHAFVPEEEYDQPRYFEDIHAWLVEGMGLELEDITYHEDAWAGGGNFGCSLEFFSGGLEIGNQVYTMYERDGDELKGLDIRVLDMGMGQERPAWFSHGTPTAYEPNFPTVMPRLFEIAGISGTGDEKDVLGRFLPYSALLNMDEVRDIDKVWVKIAAEIGADVPMLRDSVMMHAGLYSIADHSRALLFALSDGGLPSNSGGGYNLRLIFRRAQDFIERYGWDIDMGDVADWHARYLRPQYPEMLEAVPEVKEILEHELSKFRANKKKALSTVERLKKDEERGRKVGIDSLLTLYDSQGITPDLLVASGLDIHIPSDFYRRVTDLHEDTETKAKTQKEFRLDLDDHPPTGILYYDDYLMLDFWGEVLEVLDDHVVLDRTAFYPTSGGQLHDVGHFEDNEHRRWEVEEVFKQDRLIIHRLSGPAEGIEPGMALKGVIDEERRRQLAQHHTTTHIINGVSRKVLGNHIWQAGAEKTEEKGRLDITHYETLDRDQLDWIEREANRMVGSAKEVLSMILPRDEAERRYGFRLYQGGAVPGEQLRVVSIEGLDTEACGGTHLRNTKEAGRITITGTKKIQDGIVRLEYVAGERAVEMYREDLEDLSRVMALLGVSDPDEVDQAAGALFDTWKKVRKFNSKSRKYGKDPERYEEVLTSLKASLKEDRGKRILDNYLELGRPSPEALPELEPADVEVERPHQYLSDVGARFSVQRGQILRTALRFLSELDTWVADLDMS